MRDIAQSPPIPTPDPWVSRFAPLVAPQGTVLDLACGNGRHSRLFLDRGHPVTALDRSVAAMTPFKERTALELIEADIEAGPWPLGDRRFDAVVVVNYLHRPLMARIANALAPHGVLIYRTFAIGNERYGKPSNPNFLLKPNELIETFAGLDVVAYESGDTGMAVVQRICAVRRAGGEIYPLPV